MLNPFAVFLYLEPIRKNLDHHSLLKVIFKATIISFLICLVSFYLGNIIFKDILQINFESFRIFGGIVIFSFAYLFIVKGQEALIMMKEDLDDLASEIALPFMVGAGTISLSILLSQSTSKFMGLISLITIFSLNFFILIGLIKFRGSIEKRKFRIAFDKHMGILLRLNGFFIGALGVDMIIKGITNLLIGI